MSLRIRQHMFQCAECDAILVLIDYDMSCPRCGRKFPNLPRDEELYKDNVIRGISWNRAQSGTPAPLGQYIGSQADMMLSVAYKFFYALEHEKPENATDYLKEFVNKIKVGEDKNDAYLRQHYMDALGSALEAYKNQPPKEIKKTSWWEKIVKKLT